MCTKIINSTPNILSPKLDVVFQALFGEVGSEQITSKFLEAILNQKIESIDLSKNLVLRRDYPDDKLGVLDIIAKINGSEYCNIEMQVAEQEEIIERILFYWSKLYSKQIKSGKSYDTLQKAIIILITNFNVQGLESLEYHTSWKIKNEKDHTASISISRKGGHVVFLNQNRDIEAEAISNEQADEIAKKFLNEKGFPNMKET